VSFNIALIGSTDRQLEEVLRAVGMKGPSLAGSELAALAQPAARQPDVLVIDIREQSHLPAALPLLKRQHPTTGVVIVASRLDPALLLEAMRSGVNEFVTDPVTEAELEAAIARVMAQRPAPAATGQAFAFIGAKGGVGTTTVAVNVAAAIAKLGAGSTLLIDLHVANGDAAVFLGAEPRFSVADALENTHRLDEAYFRGLIAKTKSGVDLLASSDRVMVAPLDVRRIRTLIEFASRHYRFIVLDVPRSDPAVLEGIEAVSRIVIVANQELATVRSASRMASALRQRYGKDKLSIVLSRADHLAEIGQDDIERAVGAPIRHSIPSDYRRALHAVNKGRPLTLDNHNDLSASFFKFACALAGVEKRVAEKSSSALFGLFGGRKSSQQETKR
jgi:pilus assembly protein CpaE